MERKRVEKNKQSLRKLWHNTKQYYICTTGVPGGEGEEHLKQIMTEIFPNFIKTMSHKNQHQA